VLVTVGGGKDSALTLALAARNDPEALAVAVNPRAPMERTAAWAGLGLVRVERRLDRTLLELNARGAINGHVPITAIVTAAAVVAAAVLGRGTVLVSNERSADAATRDVDGWTVNHQYSKTSAFERLLERGARGGRRDDPCRVAAATAQRARDRRVVSRARRGLDRRGHQLQRGVRARRPG
jgi:UDP-N-acetyl-alpha-D-muramoyl-L-alanyl-L-glutamate epimerase